MLGFIVGCNVGLSVGSNVRCADGASEVIFVGLTVGFDVGCIVGTKLYIMLVET